MAAEFDIEPHIRTWNGFCKLMSACAVAAAVTLGLMAFFLT